MQPELSVIIVNYNGAKYLRDCFESLREHLAGIAYEIIVLDNDSKDESCTFIREHYPDVVLIAEKVNHGFGKGNNEAVKKAKGEYLLLINNDTIVLDDLKPALDFVTSNKEVGALAINMLNGNKQYLQAAGKFPTFAGMLRIKNLSNMGPEFKSGTFKRPYYEVDWLGGAFLLMPKAVYEEVGGFDESYFMYVEDVDLSRRIADKGYKRIFYPGCRYIHFVGFNNTRNKLLLQGYRIYIRSHFKGVNKASLLYALKINEMIKKIKGTLR